MATVAERLKDRIERFRGDRAIDDQDRPFLHGRPPRVSDVVLTSNDYLALSGDPRIAQASASALARAADPAHGEANMVAQRLARHMRASAGIVCQSGWDANIGLLQAIADSQTPVHIDEKAHMSLRQGAMMAAAPIHLFRHNDLCHLRTQIAEHGPGIIAADAICSTSGSRSPLPEICDIAEETGSVLVVDESHSLGIDGPEGAGAVVSLGLAARVPFRTASLAKAFAGRAGFVAVHDPEFVGYFASASHPAVFSSALRAHDLAGLAATLEVVRAADRRRARLRDISASVRNALTTMGFDLAGSSSQIVSLPTGPEAHALAVRDILERHGVLGSPFCAPATPPGRSLIRFSLHAGLSEHDIGRITLACADIRDRVGALPSTAAH